MASRTSSVASDPIFRPMENSGAQDSSGTKAAMFALLNQAFPLATVTQQVYAQKLEHRPLPTVPTVAPDARELRRRKRLDRLKRKRKPKALSAKEKRELRIYEIPKRNLTFKNFTALNELWNKYISELIQRSSHKPTTVANGPILLKADYHGAFMSVENCRCISRIGLSGICVKETRKMFEIITTAGRLLKIPKEHSLFRIEATLRDEDSLIGINDTVEWRIWGDHFLLRSGERAGRKFSGRTIPGKVPLEL